MECPTNKSEDSTSRVTLMPTGSSCNVHNSNKHTPVTSTATLGLNGNAPAFIPYDQFGAAYNSFLGNTKP